jgi:hypothetical protein
LFDRSNEYVLLGGEEHSHMFVRKQFKPNETKPDTFNKADTETLVMDRIYVLGTLVTQPTENYRKRKPLENAPPSEASLDAYTRLLLF